MQARQGERRASCKPATATFAAQGVFSQGIVATWGFPGEGTIFCVLPG
jgi:hypothetical protein